MVWQVLPITNMKHQCFYIFFFRVKITKNIRTSKQMWYEEEYGLLGKMIETITQPY